jgi:hypothetical protein
LSPPSEPHPIGEPIREPLSRGLDRQGLLDYNEFLGNQPRTRTIVCVRIRVDLQAEVRRLTSRN